MSQGDNPHHPELRSLRAEARPQAQSHGRSSFGTSYCPAWRSTSARLLLAQAKTLFASPVAEVWLEIGFGGAEHLILAGPAASECGA